MTVKAYAEANTGLSDDRLLLLVSEELEHIFVLTVVVDAVIADVHLPKDVFLRHALEVVAGIFAKRGDKREHIGMRYAYVLASASLRKAEEVAARCRVIACETLDQAIVEEGYVRILWERRFHSRGVGRDLNSAQQTDLVRILLL